MELETLRGLSRAFAAGELDRESYRQHRRELLRNIVAGEMPVIPSQAPEPEAPTVFPSEDDDGDTTQEIIPPLKSEQPSPSARTARLAAVIAVIAIIVGIVYLWSPDPAPVPDEAPASAAKPAPPDLLETFLMQNAWAKADVERLVAGWRDLSDDARATLSESTTYMRLHDAVHERLTADNALLELGAADTALTSQAQLFTVIDALGMSGPRIDAARTKWLAQRDAFSVARADDADAGTVAAATDEPPDVPAPLAAVGIATDTLPTAEVVTEQPDPSLAAAATAEPIASAAAAPTDDAELALAAAHIDAAALTPEAAAAPPAPAPTATAEPESASADAPAATVATAVATAADTATAPSERRGARTNCNADLAKSRRPYCIDILDSGEKGPVLVVLGGGSFDMGGAKTEEQPQHTVTLAQPIAIGMFEISVAEFKRYCSGAGVDCPPQPWSEEDYPVVNVSWRMANEYAAWLSQITGAEYRLPSEAEWEYAARAGTRTPFPFGAEIDPTHARFTFKQTLTTPLAAKDRSVNSNEFKLYHMVGNVREWVLDTWSKDYRSAPTDGSAKIQSSIDERVVRGGSFADNAESLRSAARMSLAAGRADELTGFRVVRVIE